jgi:nicotinamidase/pyrazinamidase
LRNAPAETDQKTKHPEAKLAASYVIGDHDALLVVDVQNDFCSDGALAVRRGDEVLPTVNQLGKTFRNVVLTQDWHPAGHLSFASAHPGRAPHDVIAMPYGPQVLWPDHCVQGTPGAAFHRDLQIPHAGLVVRKGLDPAIDSYSALYENDRTTPTGLTGYLRERGIRRLFLARPRPRFLRPLFSRGRSARGLRGRSRRGRLPWHRRPGLDCGGPRKFRGAGGAMHCGRHTDRLIPHCRSDGFSADSQLA